VVSGTSYDYEVRTVLDDDGTIKVSKPSSVVTVTVP
jgi:hypothetical protein